KVFDYFFSFAGYDVRGYHSFSDGCTSQVTVTIHRSVEVDNPLPGDHQEHRHSYVLKKMFFRHLRGPLSSDTHSDNFLPVGSEIRKFNAHASTLTGVGREINCPFKLGYHFTHNIQSKPCSFAFN